MSDTKENILLAALHLFAQNGYEAASVSDIAGALGMAKSALYKHYKNKRDIFESILARMETLDAQRAIAYELPQGALSEMEQAYKRASIRQLIAFARDQFQCWAQDDFYSSFRKMLTLEQYRSEEMRALFQQYLVSGPLGYVSDILSSLSIADARHKAVELYAPMFFFYSFADATEDKTAASKAFEEYIDRLCEEWGVAE